MITLCNYRPLLSIFMYDYNSVNFINMTMDVDVSRKRVGCVL